MASLVSISNGADTLYLSGRKTPYTGSGTPWDTQSTSPYELAMDGWTPQAAEPTSIYSGGAPFTHGQKLVHQTYNNIVETIPIQMRASTHDYAVELLHVLRQRVNRSLFDKPAFLNIEFDGTAIPGSSGVTAEIVNATVQEDPKFIGSEKSSNLIRATLTITRTPFFIKEESATISAATFTNTGTGANNNIRSFAATTGDMLYQGQPIQALIVVAGPSALKLYMSSVKARTYTSLAAAISTTSTTGVNIGSATTTAVSAETGISLRFIQRIASTSANLEMRCVVTYSSTAGATQLYASPWTAPGALTGAYLDLGFARLPDAVKQYAAYVTQNVTVQAQARSTNGASATGTLSYTELLEYYDFCRISATTISATPTLSVYEFDGGRLFNPPVALLDTSVLCEVRGRIPRIYASSSLYLAWTYASEHTIANTVTVTVIPGSLYHTMRGNG